MMIKAVSTSSAPAMHPSGFIKSSCCSVVGDTGAGKTSMLLSYTVPNCYPPFDSIPDVMDRYTANVMVDNVPVCMSLYDTNGCCSADVIRSYSGGNSCPVDNPPSFENVSATWYPEISHHFPRSKILLVGTKTDIRDYWESHSAGVKPVHITYDQGAAKAKEMNAKYRECSAVTQIGLKQVFDEAIRFGFPTESTKRTHQKSECNLQ